jgi:hypothetical protein
MLHHFVHYLRDVRKVIRLTTSTGRTQELIFSVSHASLFQQLSYNYKFSCKLKYFLHWTSKLFVSNINIIAIRPVYYTMTGIQNTLNSFS